MQEAGRHPDDAATAVKASGLRGGPWQQTCQPVCDLVHEKVWLLEGSGLLLVETQ